MLSSVSQVRYEVSRQPGETAFVLAKRGDEWRYLGVGREDESGHWAIPEVDHDTWKTWGSGDGVSRPLPNGVAARAEQAVRALIELPAAERTITQRDGRTAQVLGTTRSGGLRIGSPSGAFEERTISLTDLAWTIAASDDCDEHGGLLDEERVNKLRYLEGTPKSSTRWIDTGWAIAAWERARKSVPVSHGVHQIHADDGAPLDARFVLEQHGDRLHVIMESRGGTKGSDDERNTQYGPGLDLLLARLKELKARIFDALVDSSKTRALPMEERRLLPTETAFPITIGDPVELRRRITRAAAQVGREPGAKGRGNETKRIRLIVEAPPELSADAIARELRGPA